MLRSCYGLRFQMAMVEMLNLLCRLAGLLRLKEALPLLYEWFGPAAATLVGRGEKHSVPGVVRDGAVRAVC